MHILRLTYTDMGPPIPLSVYASINLKYMHILQQSRQYTAHRKAYAYIYVHIRQSTYHILQFSIWYVLRRRYAVYVCIKITYTCIYISRYMHVYAQIYIHILTFRITDDPTPAPCLLSPGAPGKTLRRWYAMVPVSPTGTTASFPRILWMGMT